MGKWLRRLKAMVGTGVLWGSASFVVGALASPILGALAGVGFSLAVLVETGLQFAAFGLVAGTSFAGLLSAVEGHKTLEQLSVPRVALCGAIAGLSFPVLLALFPGGSLAAAALPVMAPVLVVSTALGAGLSAGTILAAQRANEELTGAPSSSPPLPGPTD